MEGLSTTSPEIIEKVKLSDKEAMMKRLSEVNDENSLQQKFYPHLLMHAGEEAPPNVIAAILVLAAYDYTKKFKSMRTGLLFSMLPHFADAMIPDRAAAQAVKDSLKKF